MDRYEAKSIVSKYKGFMIEIGCDEYNEDIFILVTKGSHEVFRSSNMYCVESFLKGVFYGRRL